LKSFCVTKGSFQLEIGSIFLDDHFSSGFFQLALIIPGEPRSANKARNITTKTSMIKNYLQEKLYPNLRSAVASDTSSAVYAVFFSNAVFMFVNYWPKCSSSDLQLLSKHEQDAFLDNEKQFKTVTYSRALELKNVRTKSDCGQKVMKVTIYHKGDPEFNQEFENSIKTCSFKLVFELQDDNANVRKCCDLDTGLTCAQNAYWDACSALIGRSSGTDARSVYCKNLRLSE
jgi:hypothetical protein